MVQPLIPTSIPGTAHSVHHGDGPLATGPAPGGNPERGRHPKLTAVLVVLALAVVIALWKIGESRSNPDAPLEPTPPALPRG
jgi:hypothetical protein